MTALRVLYAEDDSSTRARVTELLTQELGINVVGHGVLEEAKVAYANGKFDAVILDGKLQKYDDGWTWAIELHGRGVKVLVLSTSRPPNAPSGLAYINKGESFRDVKALLVRFLNSA